MASLPTILLILAALSAGATVIAIIIAFRSQREAQSAIFPIVREQESVRAQRARMSIFVWVAITALFMGGWLASLRLVSARDTTGIASDPAVNQPIGEVAVVADTATPLFAIEPVASATASGGDGQQPTAENPAADTVEPPLPTATQAPLPSPTPEPTATFSPTPVPPTPTPTNTPVPPTATPTETPTATPTATPTPIRGIVLPDSTPRTPAPTGSRMGPIQFAENVTDELEAVNPSDIFPDGIAAVYAVFPFSGIPKGVDFTIVWYKNGVEVARDQEPWQYGESARSYSFLVPRGEGLYKLELYINDTIMASDLFEVR